MNFRDSLLLAGLFVSVSASTPAIAQPLEVTPVNSDAAPSTAAQASTEASAIDLTIPIRIGIDYSTSDAEYEGVIQLEGFIPLDQDPGETITFLVPRILLDNDGNFGSSLLLGHRRYSSSRDRILGGYVGFDSRETGNNTFYQLGLGLESLGDPWDFRVNAYIPLGDTRQLVDERRFDSGFDLSTGFEGNLLLLGSRREQRITRLYEASLFGLDAEAGVELADWDDGNGDLRGFGGLYFYDGAGVDGTLGWRLRLETRLNQNFRLGVAVQEDDIFGSNVVLSAGLTWPRVRPRGPITEVEEVPARLGEPIARLPTIPIDSQRESETIVDEVIDPLRNPEEEQPYRFVHVTLGRQAQGDGTFENPFGTIQEALDDTISDGNNIVYVDAGSNPDIPAFTIPERVRVLSQGPTQLIAGLPFPGFPDDPSRLPFSPEINYFDGILVELPLSGDGNFPQIQDAGAIDLVTMGDRTVLSGFRITDAPGNAISGNSVANVEIRDNTITNAGERGISLTNVTDSVILFDNQILGTRGGAGSGQGILIQNDASGEIEATIRRQQIEDTRVGIEVSVTGNVLQGINPEQIVNISDTNLLNSRDQGLLGLADSAGNQQIFFRGGDILNSGAEGVFAQVTNISSQELTLENSTISNSGSDGIRLQSGTLDGFLTAAQETFIRGNQILDNAGDGISVVSNEVAAQEFAIDNNQIRRNGGAGIRGVANNESFQEYVTDIANNSAGISNNQITDNGDQAITLTINDEATVITDIQDNTVSDNDTGGAPEVEVASTSEDSDVCVVLNNNNSATGFRLDNNSAGESGLFEVGDLDTIASRNIGAVSLQPNITTFTNKPDVPSCFRD